MANDFKVEISTGYVTLGDGVKLYYELRSPKLPSVVAKKQDEGRLEKVIMIVGIWGTLKHLEEIANLLVENLAKSSKIYAQILTYDHRGIGKSGPAPPIRQTSQLLANDALSLINQVWGENCQVHVYGNSMGGMIAQELAVPLIQSKRLRSLYLAVTSRGHFLRPLAFLPYRVTSFLMQFVIKSDREKMIEHVLKASFSTDAFENHGDRFAKIWLSEYDAWFSFSDRQACACQLSTVTGHYLSDEKVRLIRDAKIPITVQISTKDKLIPPKKQQELAKLLQANAAIIEEGHTIIEENAKKQFNHSFACHLKNTK